jgi:5'-3' exonuclease
MKKFTLLVDGNYFFFRTLYVLPNLGKNKSSLSLGTEKEVSIYVRKLATDFASEMRKFRPIVDEIIFSLDSKSWRKDFYPEADYKGNRKVDSTIHWDNFKRATMEFKRALEDRGVKFHKMEGAEGDDLIYAWSNFLNLDGKSVIIFSGDRDLMQLVSTNSSTNSQTLFYSGTHKKICVPPGFLDWANTREEVDIFSMSSSSSNKLKEDLMELIKANNLATDEIHPDEFVFAKVLTGDAGDNIKPVYYYTSTTKNGTRTYGISEKKAEQVVSMFKKKHGSFLKTFMFDESFQHDICKILIKELNASKMPYDTILNNLKNNANLITLSSQSIPETIHKMMFDEIESEQRSSINFDNIVKMEKILEGSGHANFKLNSDFFDDTKEDMSFIKKKNNTTTTF